MYIIRTTNWLRTIRKKIRRAGAGTPPFRYKNSKHQAPNRQLAILVLGIFYLKTPAPRKVRGFAITFCSRVRLTQLGSWQLPRHFADQFQRAEVASPVPR